MGLIDLSAQAPCTVEETLRYLQDQGSNVDDQDLLTIHINSITSMMLTVMARDRMIWVDDDEITEYRDGDGRKYIYTRNAPVRKIVSVTLLPHDTNPVTVDVPTEPALFTSEMYFDPESGLIALKSRTFPTGRAETKIVYEAGFYPQDSPTDGDAADPEYLNLKLIALSAIATKWHRFKDQKHGVASETRGDQSTSYTTADFTEMEMKDLRRYRRTMYA